MTGNDIEDDKRTLGRVPDSEGERKKILEWVMAIDDMKVFSSIYLLLRNTPPRPWLSNWP